MVIKKEDVIRGIDDVELIFIAAWDDEVPLRPWSKREINEMETIEAKAYGKFEANETSVRAAQKGKRQPKMGKSEMNSKGTIDLEKMSKAEFKGKTRGICLSMNNKHPEAEEWSEEEIMDFPNDVFDELFEAIQKLSGIEILDEGDPEFAADNFPEDK